MKKLMILLVALMAVISVAHAEFGDKETIVIKDGNTVRIFHIKDVTKDSYSWKEFEVTNYDCVDISASYLKSLEVPEGAWKLCSSSESGVYSTKEAKLAAENKDLKDECIDLRDQKTEMLNRASHGIVVFSILIAVFVASTIILGIHNKRLKNR
jgi:hypothetical protein